MITDWYTITIQILQGFWQGFLVFFPKLIGALFIFIIGCFVAFGIGKLVSEILKRLKFNRIFEKEIWKTAFEKAELKVDAAGFIGAICKWILVIVFLLIAVEILGLPQFAEFLTKVLSYLPNIMIAVLIFVVVVIIADVIEKVVKTGLETAKVGYAQIAGAIVKWLLWIFAILAILMQLNIANELILSLSIGLIAMMAIAGGIAFGLGGKEIATDILENLRKKFKK